MGGNILSVAVAAYMCEKSGQSHPEVLRDGIDVTQVYKAVMSCVTDWARYSYLRSVR